jgi:O-acetyl-ADP-ribose deacetylase (regulator of RNase III)
VKVFESGRQLQKNEVCILLIKRHTLLIIKAGDYMPFEIVRNDITKIHVDAIVNPTNTKLFGIAGVDGAIHKIEGPRLKEETSQIGGLVPGQSIMTKAFNLPSPYIIHTVGPIWNLWRRRHIKKLL